MLADMLSRAPSTRRKPSAMTSEQVFQSSVEKIIAEEVEAVDPRVHVNVSDTRVDEIRRSTASDATLQELMALVARGWPDERSRVPPSLKIYWAFRDLIATHNGILYKGECMFIPRVMQREMLTRLHSSHQGIEATLRRARDSLYWRGMMKDVKEVVASCPECSCEKPSQQKETLRSHDIIPRPWASRHGLVQPWSGDVSRHSRLLLGLL